MPVVESADRAREGETAALGEAHTTTTRHTPSAPRAEGLLRAKSAMMPTLDMIVARIADTGAPENTRYDAMTATSTPTLAFRGARSTLRTLANSPVTMTRCAPDTAMRCASPQVWKVA